MCRLSAFVAGFLVILLSPVTLEGDNGPGEFKPGEIVCEMEEGYDVETVNGEFGTSVRGFQAQTNCYLLGVPPGIDPESLAVEIELRPEVAYCGANYYLDAPEPFQRSQPFLDLEDAGDYTSQLASVTLNLISVHDISVGDGIRIAVIDGGVDLSHPEFASRGGSVRYGWDYVDGDSVANDEPGGPGSGHGTFVAGIVRLLAPSSDIYAYRVLDTLGRGDGYTIAEAVLAAVNDSCKVINLSLGQLGHHDALDDALKYAEHHDVTIVAAAGNDSTNVDPNFPFPASRSYSLAVAALDSNLVLAGFSNYGRKIDICAPGTAVYSTFPDSLYAWWDGTSFAAPMVSGTAALLYFVDSLLTRDDVASIIAGTAINIDSLNQGMEDHLGSGLINPLGALELLSGALRGDPDRSGVVDIDDVTFLVSFIFLNGEPPVPMYTGDADCTESVDIDDVVCLITYIFLGGAAPCSSE